MLEENSIKTSVDNTLESNCNLIKPINREVVHKICSGQVVLSLAIAVKELIENSIDAGGTRIDVYLREYGSDLIEISDNGTGVLEKDFEALTLKHYTSKIREFNDLVNIGTLGFRGEALSSLCALSDLTIVTKHSTAELATKITYDKNGTITNKVTTARENGTTVMLNKLFSTLPVRRKDFLKNLKREFNKMCQLLYAYCLVSKGIKFCCTNVSDKGLKNTVVATEGHKNVRENIINIFGAKQISSLVDIEITIPDNDILNDYGINLKTGEEIPFTFEFLISSVSHGNGRSSTDRQFYFINSRPCEPTRLMKLVNEIYKQYNVNQYPFVFLNIITKSSLVDVNVTPDKRQIFLENEKILLATVKASLIKVFKSFPSTFKMQNLDVSHIISSGKTLERGIKRSISDGPVKKGSILDRFKKRTKTEESITTSSLKSMLVKNSPEVLDEIEKDCDKQLRMLIDIACKLSPDKNSENIVDFHTIKKENNSEDSIDDVSICLDQPPHDTIQKFIPLNITIDDIKAVLNKPKMEENKNIKIRFRSEIVPESNKSAEDELQKQIAKYDFKKMDVIGQFNLGFIITKLNNDLFIVDQHATDEKYNFEQLQISSVIDSQILINPKPLELTAGNENILIDNIDIFKKNGFSFKIDESAPCTKKVAVTAFPVSKNCVFAKDDIDEMIFMLQTLHCLGIRPNDVQT
ncbi:mismatch repair endonuclease PMS2 isoform X2 [Anoplophora glabripennis]|uniref:mismatch repair endonuclease PMS2 isoform X2 n=1 Tax=Anoplophora glabripennis TaxID=217634 RepID=UPI0008747880|nr:mismatch repair endonuclease PMS2 isoform X2 [Anoplophora glabripennis]